MSDLYWDPFDPELRIDPYPLWKRLRDEAPIWYNEQYDFYAMTRFHDMVEAHKDWQTFRSGHGTVVEIMSPEPIDTGQILWLDPPKHTLLRGLVSRAFTNRRVTQLEDHVREVCADLLDPHVGSDRLDYVQDFSAILPPTIISALLGVPESDKEYLRHLVDDVFRVDEDSFGQEGEGPQKALNTVREYVGGQFAERRKEPQNDMFTDLLNAELEEEDGGKRRLTEEELRDFGLLLFSAGTETVARHLGFAASLLDQYPDQRAELANDFELIPGAIDEILRIEPPSPVNARWVSRDVTMHGVTMPAGSKVVLVNGSAARDERKYEDPDTLDIHRKVDLHLTFGYGIHFCLGAALARLEGRIALEETLKRWPEWEVDRDNTKMLFTSTVRGPVELPIAVAS